MKYIDADKLIAEIEKLLARANRRTDKEHLSHNSEMEKFGEDYWNGYGDFAYGLLGYIHSLQQEQPELPSGEEVMTACNQILIDWVKEGKTPEEVESRKEAHSRFFELYDEYMLQEQPDFDDVDPKHLVHSHYTKVRETKTGRVFWAEYSSEAAEWYEAGTGKAYSISDVEIVKEQPEVDLEKELIQWHKRHFKKAGTYEEYSGFYLENSSQLELARHFYELGRLSNK